MLERVVDRLAVEEARVELALARAQHKKAQLREQLLDVMRQE